MAKVYITVRRSANSYAYPINVHQDEGLLRFVCEIIVHNGAGFTMYLCDIFITFSQNKTT
jgi:hypothetical protein